MRNDQPPVDAMIVPPKPPTLAEMAALDNFLRLQQSQAEYLAWLEACEKKPEMDRYVYRKVR